MKCIAWAAGIVLLAAFDVYCLVFQWSAVGGNIAASIIWGTPAVGAHHVVIRRRVDRHHREQAGRVEAQAAQLAVVGQQVSELHNWHLRGVLPPDVLKP